MKAGGGPRIDPVAFRKSLQVIDSTYLNPSGFAEGGPLAAGRCKCLDFKKLVDCGYVEAAANQILRAKGGNGKPN